MTTKGTQAVATDSGARPFATVNPYTGETVREFPFLDSGQIPDVVGRAAKAFQSWRERPVADRARMVRCAGDLMLERKDALAALLTQEVGKRIGESAWEVGLAASILQYYGDRGPEFLRPEATSSQADLPFGGVKRSGFGRELSRLGIYGFTNRKLVRAFPMVTA